LLTLDNEFVNCIPISPESIANAAVVVARGDLAILPTDTVYGICADIRHDAAVDRIYAAKGKGRDEPLQLLFGNDIDLLVQYAGLTADARRLIETLGPGGWTVVTRAREGWSSPALAGGRTVGVRMQATGVVGDIVLLIGAPLAASSANRHGDASPTTCQAAVAAIGAACAIALDAGSTPVALDSTVVDCAGDRPRILREGAIDRRTIARILGLQDIPVLRSARP